MTREPKPGGRTERLARLEWEVSELRHSITSLRWMVLATLCAVLLPMVFSIPPLSWVASAVKSALNVVMWILLLIGVAVGGSFAWRYLRHKRNPYVGRSDPS